MLMTLAEYMAVDSQLPTSDSLSDGQITEMVTSSSQSSQAGNDEEEEGEEEGASVEEERISSSTVVNAVDTVGLFTTDTLLCCCHVSDARFNKIQCIQQGSMDKFICWFINISRSAL